MTDIQLPLHQNHQKGMNGKYIGKNSLEIRGGGMSNNSSEMSKSSSLNSNVPSSSTPQSSTNKISNIKTPQQSIGKPTSVTNIQLYPIKMNSNNENLGAAIVASVNFIDSRTKQTRVNNSNSNNSNNNSNKLENSSINFTIENQYSSRSNNSNSNLILMNAGHSLLNYSNNKNNTNSQFNQNYLLNSNNKAVSNLTNNRVSVNDANASNANNTNSHQLWHDESNSGWTGTGVMSDRSSVYSIDDGDFDKEASRKVNSQLKEIESVLYEQNSTHSSNLIEYKEWLEKFPHLRILGTHVNSNNSKEDFSTMLLGGSDLNLNNSRGAFQASINSNSSSTNPFKLSLNSLNHSSSILSPVLAIANRNNENTSMMTPKAAASAAEHDLNGKYFKKRENTELNYQELYLNGSGMPVRAIDEKELEQKRLEYSFLEEEIFAQDGVYEELLAYDNQEEEYLFEHNKRLNLNKRRRHGLPPITPKAAMKDLVTNFLFDHMWSELINWSSSLIKVYAKTITDKELNSESCGKTSPPSYNNYPTHISNPHHQNHNQQIVSTSSNPNNVAQISSSITKTNIIQLKPFDMLTNVSYNANVPGLISRDNSSLFAQLNKLPSNNIINNNELENKAMNSDVVEFDNLLKIKQLNPVNHNSNPVSAVSSNVKHLNPVVSQSRVNSANRRPQLNKDYKKRYSSNEMDKWDKTDKNIIITGAGLSKPVTLNEFSNNNSNNLSSGVNSNSGSFGKANVLSASDNTNENMDTDYTGDYRPSLNDRGLVAEMYHYSTFNYYNNHTLYHYNNSGMTGLGGSGPSSSHQPLPRIENSFPPKLISSAKPLRISSANNLKPIKERNERPMTSTATRFETGSISLINKRATTPSGLMYANHRSGLSLAQNMKVNGVRFSHDDSTLTNNNLNSFLSTKSFTLVNSNNSSSGLNNSSATGATSNSNFHYASNNMNRRNSIKDSYSRSVHK